MKFVRTQFLTLLALCIVYPWITWGLRRLTLYAQSKILIQFIIGTPYTWFLWIHSSASVDSTKPGSYSTVLFTTFKNPCISDPCSSNPCCSRVNYILFYMKLKIISIFPQTKTIMFRWYLRKPEFSQNTLQPGFFFCNSFIQKVFF